jgi:hypothetical protein
VNTRLQLTVNVMVPRPQFRVTHKRSRLATAQSSTPSPHQPFETRILCQLCASNGLITITNARGLPRIYDMHGFLTMAEPG